MGLRPPRLTSPWTPWSARPMRTAAAPASTPTTPPRMRPTAAPWSARTRFYLSAVDGEGNACSFINSLFMGTGSGLVVPGTRGQPAKSGLSFRAGPGSSQRTGPQQMPYETIIPAMTVRGGELHASFGVMGRLYPTPGPLSAVDQYGRSQAHEYALDLPAGNWPGRSPVGSTPWPPRRCWRCGADGGRLGHGHPGPT